MPMLVIDSPQERCVTKRPICIIWCVEVSFVADELREKWRVECKSIREGLVQVVERFGNGMQYN